MRDPMQLSPTIPTFGKATCESLPGDIVVPQGPGREVGVPPSHLLMCVKLRCRLYPATRNYTCFKNSGVSERRRDQPLCILKGKKRASETFLRCRAAMETNGLFGSFLVLDVGVQLQFYFLKTCTNLPGFLGREERKFFLTFIFYGFVFFLLMSVCIE